MRHDVIIVGGGVSGLATGYWLRALRPELSVVVLEAGESAGGHVTSTSEEGFTVDWGPSAVHAGAPDTQALIEALGLDSEIVPSAPGAQRRFVVRRGALVAVPGSPRALVASPLLSPAGKLRAVLEPLVRRGADADESVSEFLGRRFGRAAAEAIDEVLVTGLVAGDPARLSAAALFPRLVALEREHGSLLRGFVAQRRTVRPAGRPGASGGPDSLAGRGSASGATGMFTFSGGLGRLTVALASALGPALLTDARVNAVRASEDGFHLELARGRRLAAASLVLATPAPVTAELVSALSEAAARELRCIPYVGVGVAAVGYARDTLLQVPDGFGFLAPRGQGVRSLGVLFSTSTFPGLAPGGGVLLRAITGGSLDAEFLDLDDAEALAEVKHDLEVTLGITAATSFARYRRLAGAIPQYETGHAARLVRIEEALAPWPGLQLIGNAYRGVGVNDCLREARALSRQLAATRTPPAAPVRSGGPYRS